MMLKELQAATLKARSESGIDRVGTRVSCGAIQIIEWDDKDNLTAISRFMPISHCIDALNHYSTRRDSLMEIRQE